ncbi:hypothetical protein EB796_017534 [Bugula neritina]|uniref:Uncharacterized protein n=1 Tax=Bugula neritina TaxID=10212 RepID=A0A7J7JCY5_BUGNE|nr:hypothetical protein EB796_017534 [Bugula neritina]
MRPVCEQHLLLFSYHVSFWVGSCYEIVRGVNSSLHLASSELSLPLIPATSLTACFSTCSMSTAAFLELGSHTAAASLTPHYFTTERYVI